MKNLKKIVFPVMLGLALLTSCGDKPKEILNTYKGTYQKDVQTGAGYQKYAIELKREYPEKLGGLDSRDIYMFLSQELNDNKMLMKDGKAIKPSRKC